MGNTSGDFWKMVVERDCQGYSDAEPSGGEWTS